MTVISITSSHQSDLLRGADRRACADIGGAVLCVGAWTMTTASPEERARSAVMPSSFSLRDRLARGATTGHYALVVDRCAQCDWPVEMHDRDVRFVLPDRIAAWDPLEVESRTEGNGTFLKVDADQFYMRAILPVHLTDGHLVAFGVWLEVEYETIDAAFEVWDSTGYAGFACSGRLANDLPPWPGAALGALVDAEVRDLAELPYIIRSANVAVQHILDVSWEHATVLDRLAAGR